jgi:hypothetical protein
MNPRNDDMVDQARLVLGSQAGISKKLASFLDGDDSSTVVSSKTGTNAFYWKKGPRSVAVSDYPTTAVTSRVRDNIKRYHIKRENMQPLAGLPVQQRQYQSILLPLYPFPRSIQSLAGAPFAADELACQYWSLVTCHLWCWIRWPLGAKLWVGRWSCAK